MVLAMIPAFSLTASAESLTVSGGGTGIAGDPYKIANLTDLEAFCEYINGGNGSGEYFELTAPIDMSSKYSAGSDTSWTPIGTSDKTPFNGTFDGGDFEINGLYINTEDYYKGLFGYSTGTIKNLTVSGSVTGGTYTGGIVGYNKGGSVENCCNTNAVNGSSSTSGIAGYNNGGSIENCYNTGAVTGTGNRIGGIAGNNSGSVKNCYNTGTVSGAGYVGGIVGENSGAVIVGSDSGSIKSCYNTGTVSSTNTYIGGIAGSNSDGSVKYCYYLDTCGAGGRFGGTSKTSDKFASGEVAWLLQSNQDMPDQQVWGQKLSDKADEYPVLTTDATKKVLKVTFVTQDNKNYDVKYTNLNKTVTLPETPVKDNYTFEKWAKTQNADGEEFDGKTAVTEDMTVYAVGRDHFGGDSADITLSGTYGYKAPLTVNLDEHMKYANKSVAATGKFTYEISNKGNTNASIESENTLSVPTGLDADDYTITVKATEKTPQYSLMSVESYGTEAVTLTVKVHIANAASSVTVKPTAKDLTYNGEEQELVTAGETEDGTIHYSLDNADYSADIPKGTKAKTYTVWYKVVGDSNHNDSTPQKVDVTIKKANSDVTVANSSATYGDTLTLISEVKKRDAAGISLMSAVQDQVDFKAGETSLGTATVEYSDGELKSVGTATLTVTVDKAKYDAIKAADGKITAEYGGSVNLNESTKDNITVTLNKKTLTYTAAATNRKYNGDTNVEVTLEPTNAESSDTVTLTAMGTIDDANAGNGKSVTITGVTVGGADAEYYQAAAAPTETVTVNIEKADSTVVAPTAKTDLTYNGTAQEFLATAGSATGGELQYKVDEGEYSTAAPTATTAGEHTVYYKVVGNDNYNGIDEQSITVNIAKAKPTFPTVDEVDGGTYEPNKKLSSVPVPEVDGGTLAWSDGNTALTAGANSVQAVFTPANSENYEPTSITDTVTVNVAKATITGVEVQDVTARFDESQPTKQYTLAAPTGTIAGDTVRYAEGDYNADTDESADWKETCPSYSNEGTDKTITIKIERENYNTLYIKATIQITNEPAISGVDVTANDGLVYNGSAQELVTVTGASDSDTVTYYVNDDPVGSTEKATGTNAGDYSVKVKVEREGYHHFEKTIDVTIAKANSTAVVTPKDLTYKGTEQELVTGEAVGGELQYSLDNDSYSTTVPTGTNADTYTVWYKVVGDENHNDTEPQSVDVTIKKANSTLAVDGGEVTYRDTITLTAAVARDNTSGIRLAAAELDKVEFFLNETSLGTANVTYDSLFNDSGTATLEITADKRFAIGTNTIRAEYGGSVNLNGSGNNSITVTMKQKPLTYDVTADGKVYDENTSVNVTLTPTNNGEDDVTLTAKGAVSSPNAGNYGKVNLTEIAIDGGDAQYYSVDAEKSGADLTSDVEIAKAKGRASVTMADYKCGDESVNPVPSSDTNGTESVTYSYAAKGTDDYGEAKPLTAGEYTVRAVFASTDNYTELTVTDDFTVSHEYSSDWKNNENNHWHECVCGARSNETAHEAVIDAAIPATCTDAGKTEGSHCDVCGYVITAQTETDALGHSYGSWTITIDPTQTAAGKAKRVCALNGEHQETTDVPALSDSSWIKGERREPTETEEGYQKYTSDEFGEFTEVLPTLNAPPTYGVRGTTIDGEGNPKAGVHVVLKQGNTIFGSQDGVVSDEDGEFKFTGVGAGVYNIVAEFTTEDATVTVTEMVAITDSDVDNVEVRLPTAKADSILIVENNNDTPDVVVGGLDSVASDEASDIPDTSHVTVTMTVETQPADSENAEQQGIDEICDNAAINFIDIALVKQIDNGTPEHILETRRQLTIVVPFDTANKRNILVYRYHDGEAAALANTADRGDYFTVGNGYVTIYTSKFSTYAIGYDESSSPSSSRGGGGGFSSYTVQFETNGGSKVTSQRISRNGVVKEPTAPTKDGYTFVGWYTDKDLTAEYDFTSKVTKSFTLYAKWNDVKSDDETEATPAPTGEPTYEPDLPDDELYNPFTDVTSDYWFYEPVLQAYRDGIMEGVTDTTFEPLTDITRGMFITVLYRMEDEPETDGGYTFTDVPSDAYYADAVAWASANGIVKGYSDTEYAPDDVITREQAAAIMFRYATYKGEGPTGAWAIRLDYSDLAEISDWALESVMFCTMKDIMVGRVSGEFDPKANITRAEGAAVFERYLNMTR